MLPMVWMMLVACSDATLETNDTDPSMTCSCEGVATLEFLVVDDDGAPVLPDEVLVEGPEGEDLDVYCADDVCEVNLWGWGSEIESYSVTVRVGTAHTTTVVDVDEGEIDAVGGCDCQNWTGTYEVAAPG